MTQLERIVAYIKANPGCTTMDLTLALRPFVANPRARISDARAAGVDIECFRRGDGVNGYRVKEARFVPVEGEQQQAFG